MVAFLARSHQRRSLVGKDAKSTTSKKKRNLLKTIMAKPRAMLQTLKKNPTTKLDNFLLSMIYATHVVIIRTLGFKGIRGSRKRFQILSICAAHLTTYLINNITAIPAPPLHGCRNPTV